MFAVLMFLSATHAYMQSSSTCPDTACAIYQPLTSFAPAKQYCATRFPPGTVTETQSVGICNGIFKRSSISSSTYSSYSSTPCPVIPQFKVRGQSELMNSLQSDPAKVGRTACSCIQTSKTSTKTVTCTTTPPPSTTPSSTTPYNSVCPEQTHVSNCGCCYNLYLDSEPDPRAVMDAGSPLATFHSVNRASCQRRCDAIPECMSWSIDYATQQCYLYDIRWYAFTGTENKDSGQRTPYVRCRQSDCRYY